MSGSTYSVKNLRITFTLTNSNAVFPGTSANQLQVAGLRMSAVIKGSGIPAFPEASVRIYGMAQQDMNALAIVQVQGGTPEYTRNTVQIEADSGNGYTFIFSGQIYQAGPDYSNAPEVCLFVHAQAAGFDQLTPANPTAYPGTANVADIVEQIASKMSMAFENDGVTGTLTNAYYSGTLRINFDRYVKMREFSTRSKIKICSSYLPRVWLVRMCSRSRCRLARASWGTPKYWATDI